MKPERTEYEKILDVIAPYANRPCMEESPAECVARIIGDLARAREAIDGMIKYMGCLNTCPAHYMSTRIAPCSYGCEAALDAARRIGK